MSEDLTVERASELFAELLPGHGPVSAASRFAEGTVTGAFRIDFARADVAPVVLKIYRSENLWWAAKEAGAQRFLTAHGIDISPRTLAFSKCAAAIGALPCVVSAMLPGRTLTTLDDELTDAQRYELYRQLGEVLARLHAIPAAGYGYITDEILDPRPDNTAHMARVFERELRRFRESSADPALAGKLAAYVEDHASAFAECPRPAYCHGDVHEPNLLAELGVDGSCTLTGLLDPLNMHAGDPLMDFVRLDAFSMLGDATKIAGVLSGYGVSVTGGQPGQWPEAWRSRLPLYRIALALELYNWFSSIGEAQGLPALGRQLRELMGERVPTV